MLIKVSCVVLAIEWDVPTNMNECATNEAQTTTWKGGRISESIRCVLANNPSPYVFCGTNTWIISRTTPGRCYVFDPGPDLPEHVKAIIDACSEDGLQIDAIFNTHDHVDHSSCSQKLAHATGAPLYSKKANNLPLGNFEASADLPRLLVVPLPGHSSDSLGFAFPDIHAIVTGDLLFEQSPTTISVLPGSLGQYFESLDALMSLVEEDGYHTLLTGHGLPVDDPRLIIQRSIDHRKKRLDAVAQAAGKLRVLNSHRIWKDVYFTGDRSLYFGARINVLAQLQYLRTLDDPRVRGKKFDFLSRQMMRLVKRLIKV